MADEKWKHDRIRELNRQEQLRNQESEYASVETFTKCNCTECDCHKDALFEICAYCAKGLHHTKEPQ